MSLVVSQDALRTIICDYLGLGRTYSSASAADQARIDSYIAAGERQFYYPPPLPGERYAHSWSFLRAKLSLAVAYGGTPIDEVSLPAGFSGFMEPYLSFSENNNVWNSLELVGPGIIFAKRQQSSFAPDPEHPKLAAVQGTSLMLWPAARRSYTITGVYHSNPSQTGTVIQPHAETLVESCLAAAEVATRDAPGIHSAKFLQRLAASVSHDRRFGGPQNFGYNGDRSVLKYKAERPVSRDLVTYNGQSYEG